MKKMVHGVMVNTLVEELEQVVRYAKTCMLPQRMLYQALGQIKMAYRLGGITKEEYFKLDALCVRDGINNPKYF